MIPRKPRTPYKANTSDRRAGPLQVAALGHVVSSGGSCSVESLKSAISATVADKPDMYRVYNTLFERGWCSHYLGRVTILQAGRDIIKRAPKPSKTKTKPVRFNPEDIKI